MSVVILTVLLLSFLCNTKASSINNNGIMIKNKILKFILFNDTKNIKIYKEINKFYKICYNKSITGIIQKVTEYNNLSEEEKELIEAIISLCY